MPVPHRDRVLPTIGLEGYDHLRTSDVIAPIMHEDQVMIGSLFVGPDRLRRTRDAHGVYVCDINGRRVGKRTILRPPSHSEASWADLTDQALRRAAWEDYWSNRAPPLPENIPHETSGAAAGARALLSACVAPRVGDEIVLPSP